MSKGRGNKPWLTVTRADRRNSHKKSTTTSPNDQRRNAMTKMTYTQALEVAINVLSTDNAQDTVVEKLYALKATLDKRATTPRKPTKAHKESEDFRATVKDFVVNSGLSTLTVKETATALNTTPQRIAAAFTALVKNGVLVKGDGWYEVAGE